MRKDAFRAYMWLVLEELCEEESLEEMGSAGSGGGNTAGAGGVMGYTAPLGATKKSTRKKKRNSVKK